MKKIIAITLLSAALAAPAFASEFATSNLAAPFYAGVQVGDGITVLAGYQIDKMFAVEADYTNYGGRASLSNCGVTNCGDNVNYTSLGVFGVATFQLALQNKLPLSLFAKAGIVRTTATSRVSNLSYSTSDIGLGLGGGVQYDFNKQISGRLGLDINTYYANNLYVGAIFKF